MQKIVHKRVWIRVAGHADMIKASTPYHWRCFVDKTGPEIPLKEWRISGEANSENLLPGTNASKDKNGLLAWIDFFGNITVENDVAEISLLPPR